MSFSKRLSSIIAFSATALLLLFGGCKNPFEAGLGDKVDINRPEISLTSHVPGEFLQEVVTFSGAASDDSRVTAVRISFDSGATWSDVSSYDAGAKTWQHILDTTTYPNGTFKVLLRVIDDSSKQIGRASCRERV